MSWAMLLLNYTMHFSFLGCEGRGVLVAGMCEFVVSSLGGIFVTAGISLPLLTFVFLVRIAVTRKWWVLEFFLIVFSWVLFVSSASFFPTS